VRCARVRMDLTLYDGESDYMSRSQTTLLRLVMAPVLTWFACQPLAPPTRRTSAEPLKGIAGAALLPMIQKADKEFHNTHPEIRTEISEGRSNVAIQKLLTGEAGLAFTSRPLRASDLEQASAQHKQLHMVVIAAEAVALIVHPQNPVRNMSVDELRKVFFSGEIRDWEQLTNGQLHGPIKVIAVNPKTSGTGELFVSTISGDDKPKYVAGADLVDYSDVTVAKVAADPAAISFSGMGNVDASVHALTINSIAPTEKAILDTSYVLNRKLFAISPGLPKGSGRDFIKFLLSDAGQHVARASGATPIALE
jgi:phosphate transport system substrate-binding protein